MPFTLPDFDEASVSQIPAVLQLVNLEICYILVLCEKNNLGVVTLPRRHSTSRGLLQI